MESNNHMGPLKERISEIETAVLSDVQQGETYQRGPVVLERERSRDEEKQVKLQRIYTT